jgi:flagellar basal-body rod protein FlgC
MKLDRLFAGFNLSGSGLSAQRKKMNAIASNIANAETTRTPEGGAYRRKVVSFSATAGQPFAATLDAAIGLTATDEGHLSGAALPGGELAPADPGVNATEAEDPSPFITVHDPGHPDADADGYVKMPNVNIVTEMVDMMSASRAFEANVVAISAAKNMAKDSLEI